MKISQGLEDVEASNLRETNRSSYIKKTLGKLKNLIAEAGRDDYPNDVHSHELKNVLCCSPDVSDSLQLNFFKEDRPPGYSNMAV